MKILLPAHQAGTGGLGRSAEQLAEALPAALPPGDELVVLRGGGRRGKLGRLVQEQLVVARAARAADLVHLTDHRPLVTSRTPFLLTIYDVFYFDHPEWFPPPVARYKRAMLRLALAKRPALVVCGSDYARRRFAHHFQGFPDRRVRVIHPGIAPPQSAEAPADAGRYLLTVSTIEARKNHAGLLRAYRRARREGLELTWKVVGAPGYLGRGVAAALAAEDGVELVGHTDDDELERLYRGALLYASPSFAEGFGFTPLEAMARGVPVVCSSGTALDESVGDAGVRVDPRDEAGWAAALLRLAGDAPERDRLREAGLVRAASFDWARTARAYADAYHAAVGRLSQNDA